MRLLGQFQAFPFFYEEILHAQKSIKKHKKAQKSTKKHKKHKKHKRKQADFHSDVFYAHKKYKKHKKRLSLRCFLCV